MKRKIGIERLGTYHRDGEGKGRNERVWNGDMKHCLFVLARQHVVQLLQLPDAQSVAHPSERRHAATSMKPAAQAKRPVFRAKG